MPLTYDMRTLAYAIPLAVMFTACSPARADYITHSDQRIHIQYPSSLKKTERQRTYSWLQRVADALLTVYGEWPKDKLDISIQKGSSGHSPVPWGQVIRGKPDRVLLVVNPESGLQELTSDWTAFHELSHLLIPYSGHGNMWFSEGLATYYQNIIQARSGLLNETELWGKLASGFERGRKQNKLSHIDLAEISDNMRKYRNFMRVHWSGVHYWLTADIKLRRISQNKMTLDSLLKQLKDCCQQRSMSAVAIAEKLDQIAESNLPGVSIFKPLFDEYRVSRTMPDYKPVLTSLGVVTNEQDHEYGITLITDVPNIDIRRSIYKSDGQ